MDKEIRDAIKTLTFNRHTVTWCEESAKQYRDALDLVIGIAERYLEVGMPEKVEIQAMTTIKAEGWNEAIDDYRIWLAKRLDGIKEIIASVALGFLSDSQEEKLESAIRKHLGGENE